MQHIPTCTKHQPTVPCGATYKFNKYTDNHKSISSEEPTKTVKEELQNNPGCLPAYPATDTKFIANINKPYIGLERS